MNDQLAQLVNEVAQITGSPKPDLLASDAPIFHARPDAPFYLIGIIGGKEVGKTALVNALAGTELSPPTAFGRGTEIAIAYAHESQARALSDLLEHEAPGRFRIVTHALSHLRRQVLLDLPDIDSRYVEHVDLTRRMLKHMLYPVWIQSIEKYADQQPQKLLAAVAQGNDPSNFLFCLNKCDQADAAALAEIRTDSAQRLARVLKLAADPRVYLISAIQPAKFELPELRAHLGQERSSDDVARSIHLASRQQQRSVLGWLDAQRLPERVAMLERLLDQAQELSASRIAEPLVDELLPRIASDPAHRLVMTDAVLTARMARWPLVNLVHTLLAPLLGAYRVSAAPGAASAAALVRTHLSSAIPSVSDRIQATFAQLHQSNPLIGDLYSSRKLWDEMIADGAEEDLAARLTTAVERQRAEALERLVKRRAWLAPLRWLLTIGALLWFPFVQPVLEIFLQQGSGPIVKQTALLVVQILSATYLLRSAGFLVIWFLVLWLYVRWNTSRKVTALLSRWQNAREDSPVNLAAATLRWIEDLLCPITTAQDRLRDLIARINNLRETSAQAA